MADNGLVIDICCIIVNIYSIMDSLDSSILLMAIIAILLPFFQLLQTISLCRPHC